MKKAIKISNLIQNEQPPFIYLVGKSSSIITFDAQLWHLRGRYITTANTTISTKFTSRCVFCTVSICFAVHIGITMVIIACGTDGYDMVIIFWLTGGCACSTDWYDRYGSIFWLTGGWDGYACSTDWYDRYDSIFWLTGGCDGYACSTNWYDRYDSILWLTGRCDPYCTRNACKIHNKKIKQNILLH